MSKLYTFGCSFSWNMSIDENDSYPVRLSNDLDLKLVNKAFPALCNDEIYSRFISSFSEFSENDLIIYQFTFPSRKGFLVNNSHYESSAGYFDDVVNNRNELRKDNPFVDHKIIDYLIANSDYSSMFNYFTIQRVVSLLEYLQTKVGIKYRLLFITEEYSDLIIKMNGDKTTLRVDGKSDYEIKDRFFINFIDKVVFMDDSTLGILDYILPNNLCLSKADSHPNSYGHLHIFNRIKQTL